MLLSLRCAAAGEGLPVHRAAPAKRRPAAVELRRSDLGFNGVVKQSVSVEELGAPEMAVGLPPDARVALELDVTQVGLSYYVRVLARCEDKHVHACGRCGRETESEDALSASFEVFLQADQRRKKGSAGEESAAGGGESDVIAFPPHANAVDLSLLVRDALLLALPACPSCPDCAAAAAAGQRVVAQYSSGPAVRPLSGLAALQKLRKS